MDLRAISSAVQAIGELITQEVTSLLGVEDQIEDLQMELIWMKSFLKEADARKARNELVRASVAAIRELAYDVEDIIETFALKVASKRKNAIRRSACILREAKLLRRTKSEIEKITARITKLTRRLQTYDVKISGDEGGSSSSRERMQSRRPYPHIIEDNIVGLNDDIKTLVSVLVDEESDRRVVSICGMGGLGKTTLAKKVYRHSQVVGHFNRLAWVYVSQQFQVRKVWEDILSSLTSSQKGSNLSDGKLTKKLSKLTSINERGSKQSDEDLTEKLCGFLKDNKCLVVLDDIWSNEAWDSLKPAFPERDTSSKILLTSRNTDVVSHADRRGYLYELQCLTDEQSWELLEKIAFPERDPTDRTAKIDEEKEKLGKDMVKHCAGLPLAVVVLGGILATKNSSYDWQIVSDNVKSNIKRSKGQSTEDVLALSYDDLPPYLKPCFLYLSHFPEDYKIDAKRLIQFWVAEGIVSSMQEENEGKITERVAEDNINELAERCMILVRERDSSFKIKTFQMHDLMRDLCLSKAKQENFLFITDESNTHSHGHTVHRIRRVAAQISFEIQRIKSPHLRSLLIFNDFFPWKAHVSTSVPLRMSLNYLENHESDCNPWWMILALLSMCIVWPKMRGIWTYMLNNFKLLRVLNFEGQNSLAGCKITSDIGSLIHLRFLSLNGLGLISSKLPSSLGNLRCLQTLDLRVESKYPSVHVPNVIWRMEQLRHLYLPERCDRKTKLKLGTLIYLQTLVNFSTKNCYLKDLLNMANLSELGICLPFNIKDFQEDLQKNSSIFASKHLRFLSIQDEYSGGNGKFEFLSDHVQILRSLSKRNGDKVEINPKHLAHLLSSCVNICELRLSIKIRKLPEYHLFPSSISYICLSFSRLKEDPMLTLEKLPNLRILEFAFRGFTGKEMVCSAPGFPKLDSLILHGLLKLKEWKVDEGAMPVLRHLEINYCENLKTLPDGLKFITTLQELKIEWMSKTFKDKLVEGGEDFYKVQRVPSIIFQGCDNDLLT